MQRVIEVKYKKNHFKDIRNQREYLERLYHKHYFHNLEDWLHINTTNLKQHEPPFKTLLQQYSNNVVRLLQSAYPNYPWLEKKKTTLQGSDSPSLLFQRQLMDSFAEQLKIKELADWQKITKEKFIRSGGRRILERYDNEWEKLLRSIYPHYPFERKQSKLEKKTYKTKEEQTRLVEQIYERLALRKIQDWYSISISKLIECGGKQLLALYRFDLSQLFAGVYPHYPWDFSRFKSLPFDFTSKIKQREYMERLYHTLALNSFDEWIKLTRKQLLRNGGGKLWKIYKGDYYLLLSSIYPHYPFDRLKFTAKKYRFFKTIEMQRLFLDHLYRQLHLTSIAEWVDILITQLKSNGGGLICKYYKYDQKAILEAIYPHYPWAGELRLRYSLPSKEYYRSLDHQRDVMTLLSLKFNLQSLDGWLSISLSQIKQNGGAKIVKYYRNNLPLLLKSIYPHHHWKFPFPTLQKKSHKIEYQREFMEHLFHSLQLKSLSGFRSISPRIIREQGGKAILTYYQKNTQLLLSCVFPNYPWRFDRRVVWPMRSVAQQRLFLDHLFHLFHLHTLDDWMNTQTIDRIAQNGGRKLLREYKNDPRLLFRTLYPYYPFPFHMLNIKSIRYFKSMENQRQFLHYLFDKFALKSMDDWLEISRNRIALYGGKMLLRLYNDDLIALYSSIFPNYPWNFLRLKSETIRYFQSIDNQRAFMTRLYSILKLKSIDEWVGVSTAKFSIHGGRSLLKYYSFDHRQLLRSVYPTHPWRFQINNSPADHKIHSLLETIRHYQRKYSVREKRDWYRLPNEINRLRLLSSLSFVYPHEKWDISLFQNNRAKKISQRLLYSFLLKLYPSHLIFENYHHPHILQSANASLEYDVFIPSLNMALEYQGEQHFHDIPSGFAGTESFQVRDKLKETLSSILQIKLLYIPYWWDQSLPSLLASLGHPRV